MFFCLLTKSCLNLSPMNSVFLDKFFQSDGIKPQKNNFVIFLWIVSSSQKKFLLGRAFPNCVYILHRTSKIFLLCDNVPPYI